MRPDSNSSNSPGVTNPQSPADASTPQPSSQSSPTTAACGVRRRLWAPTPRPARSRHSCPSQHEPATARKSAPPARPKDGDDDDPWTCDGRSHDAAGEAARRTARRRPPIRARPSSRHGRRQRFRKPIPRRPTIRGWQAGDGVTGQIPPRRQRRKPRASCRGCPRRQRLPTAMADCDNRRPWPVARRSGDRCTKPPSVERLRRRNSPAAAAAPVAGFEGAAGGCRRARVPPTIRNRRAKPQR